MARGVVQPDPGEIGRIDEGLLRRQSGHPPGDVPGQGDHLGDAPVPLRRLLPPPQHARRHDRQIPAQLDQAHSRARGKLLLVRQVAAVQSRRIPRGQRLEPAVDAHGAPHLAVAGKARDLRRSGPRAAHHLTDAGRGRGGELLRVLLRHAGRRLPQRRGPGCGRDQVAGRVVQPGLDCAGPQVDADQVLLRHASLVLGVAGTGKHGLPSGHVRWTIAHVPRNPGASRGRRRHRAAVRVDRGPDGVPRRTGPLHRHRPRSGAGVGARLRLRRRGQPGRGIRHHPLPDRVRHQAVHQHRHPAAA